MSQRRRSEKEGYNIEFSGPSLLEVMLQMQKFLILNQGIMAAALEERCRNNREPKVVNLSRYKRSIVREQ